MIADAALTATSHYPVVLQPKTFRKIVSGSLVALVVLIIIIACVAGSMLLFVKRSPIKKAIGAVGGNTSVSLINNGVLTLFTEAINVMLGEDSAPTSFFMAACDQVKQSSISLPKKPPTFIREDEFDTNLSLNYFGTDLPVYSAGHLQISYRVSANSSVQYPSVDSCPLQLFLFDANSTYQQFQDNPTFTGYIQKSPCLLNASQVDYFVNQTSTTLFAVKQSQPGFYFVVVVIKKGVSMTAEIAVDLTVYETDNLSSIACSNDVFPVKCSFPVSNSSLDFSDTKVCLYAKSLDDVTPPYFTLTLSSTTNLKTFAILVSLPVAVIIAAAVCLLVMIITAICYRARRKNVPPEEARGHMTLDRRNQQNDTIQSNNT